MISTNAMLAISMNVIQSFSDLTAADYLAQKLSDTAVITLEVNGNLVERNKAEYLENTKKALNDNIESIIIKNATFEILSQDTVLIKETSVHKRKGLGLAESGPGEYLIEDEARYTFALESGELKITKFSHIYTKKILPS